MSKNLEVGYYADTIAVYVRVSWCHFPLIQESDIFKAITPTLLSGHVSAHASAISWHQKMVATWVNHPPLVGCFQEEDTSISHVNHFPDDGHQMLSGSSGKETVWFCVHSRYIPL